MLFSRKLMLAMSVALAACGSDSPTQGGPCGRGELSACGSNCSALSVCPAGLFCAEGLCRAECTEASAAKDCGGSRGCGLDGRCSPALPALDASSADAGQSDASVFQPIDGGGGGGGDGEVCGRVMLDARPKTPNVMLIIDQSSSMDEPFGSSDRWTSLKNSLLADNGLIKELEGIVRFGATFYSASNGQEIMPPPAECPVLTEVGIELNNFGAIRDAYPTNMIEDTPTGDSIEAILTALQGGSVLDPQATDPTIFILATDGEPDTCEELDPQNGQQEAINAVEHAFSLGIRTYVISLAANTGDISDQHLNDLANAGVGMTSGQAPSYRPDDDQGLREALRAIVGGVVECTVPLEGTVTTDDPCTADVRIGGEKLACDDPNGFKLVGSQVELRGSACDALKAGKLLTATFPCGGAVPI